MSTLQIAQIGLAVATVASAAIPGGQAATPYLMAANVALSAGASYEAYRHQPDKTGPRLTNLAATSSAEGNPIEVVYGTASVAGNLIWAAPVTEIKVNVGRSGGKGGGPSTFEYHYYGDFAIALCDGPIDAIRKIWANGTLVYDISDTASNETLLASKKFGQQLRFYSGSETQLPDPTIETNLGVDNTSAYRGTAYVVFTNFSLDAYYGVVPNMQFELVRAASPTASRKLLGTLPNWAIPTSYANDPQYTSAPKLNLVTRAVGADQINCLSWNSQYLGSPTLTKVDAAGTKVAAVLNNLVGIGGGIYPFRPIPAVNTSGKGARPILYNGDVAYQLSAIAYPVQGTLYGGTDPKHNATNNRVRVRLLDVSVLTAQGSLEAIRLYTPTTDAVGAASNSAQFDELALANNIVAAIGHESHGVREVRVYTAWVHTHSWTTGPGRDKEYHSQPYTLGYKYSHSASLPSETVAGSTKLVCTSTWVPPKYRPGNSKFGQEAQLISEGYWDNVIYALAIVGTGEAARVKAYKITGTTVTEHCVIDRPVERFWVSPVTANNYYVVIQHGLQVSSVRLLDNELYEVHRLPDTPEASADSQWIVTNSQLIQITTDQALNTFSNVYGHQMSLAASPTPLQTVVTELLDKVGVELEGTLVGDVRGYAINSSGDVRASLEPLRQAYLFDLVETPLGKLRPVFRGGEPVAVVPLADVVSPVTHTRTQDLELPGKLVVSYSSADNDYAVGTQPAVRQVSDVHGVSNVALPLVLSADEAATLARTYLRDAWNNRDAFEVELPRKYDYLDVADVITLQSDAMQANVRIVEKDFSGTTVKLKTLAEAPLFVDEDAPAPAPTPSVVSVQAVSLPTASIIEVFDIPPVRASDFGKFGVYVGACGFKEPWNGCVIQLSSYGAWDHKATVKYASDLGVMTEGLAAWATPEVVDTTNMPVVVMNHGQLSSITDEQFLAGNNLIIVGGEAIYFRDATLVAENTYLLANLLRGRFGTTTVAHAEVENIVVVNENLLFVELPVEAKGSSVAFRAVPGGESTSSAIEVSVVPTAPRNLASVDGLKLVREFLGSEAAWAWDAVEFATGYEVSIVVAGEVKHTARVADTAFTYSAEEAQLDGGPWRAITIQVVAFNSVGVSAQMADLEASNPQIPALTGLSVTPGVVSLDISCTKPSATDFAGIQVWISNTSGFTPGPETLVYDGAACLVTIAKLADGSPLVGGTPYYLRAAGYDAFGKDALVYSSELTATPIKFIGEGEIDQAVSEATAEITSRVGSLESWQQVGTDATKILGQIQESQVYLPTLTASAEQSKTRLDTITATVAGNQATNDSRYTALANADNALSARADTIAASLGGGANLLQNAGFDVDLAGWELGWNQNGDSSTDLIRDLAGSSWVPTGLHTLGINRGGTPTGIQDIKTVVFPQIQGGQRVCLSGYLAAHRTNLRLIGVFLDADYASLGAFSTNDSELYKGGSNLANWTRVFAFAVAPAGTVRMQILLRAAPTGEAEAYCWLCRPMLEIASAAQTQPSAWNEGTTGMTAAINSASQAYVTPLAAQTSRIDTLTATASTALSTANAASTKADQAQATADGKASAASVQSLQAVSDAKSKSIFVPGSVDYFYPVKLHAAADEFAGVDNAGQMFDFIVRRGAVHQDGTWMGTYAARVVAQAHSWGNTPGRILEISQTTGLGAYIWGLGRVFASVSDNSVVVWLRGGMTHYVTVSNPAKGVGVVMPDGSGNLADAQVGTLAPIYKDSAPCGWHLNETWCPDAQVGTDSVKGLPQLVSDVSATINRVSQVETSVAGKASASEVSVISAQVNQTNRNLLNVDVWRDGQNRNALNGWDGWGCNGAENTNVITMNVGPYGEQCLIWQSIGYSGGADGGWNRDNISVDGSVMHRLTCWIRPVSGNATAYLGTNNIKDIGGGANGNPYFAVAQHPAPLQNGRWYLFVGYIMQAGYGGGQQGQSGIYDGETGEKIAGGTDYQFISAASQAITHRAYQFYGSEGCEQWFALPRIDKCDGQEPSISDLLSGAIKKSLSATITNVQSVQANLQGQINAKVGILTEVVAGDGRKKITGFQSNNNGTISDFVITSDQVLITAGGTALNDDPYFQDPSAWVGCSVHDFEKRDVADSWLPAGKTYWRRLGSGGPDFFSKRFYPVDPRKTYKFSCWIMCYKGGGNPGTCYPTYQLVDAVGNNIAGNGSFWYPVGTLYPEWFSDWGWAKYEVRIGAGTAWPIPAAAKLIRPGALMNYGWQSGAGGWGITDLRIEECIDANLIVDGGIEARHITAGAITAEKINVNSLSAIKATLGAVTAGRITGPDGYNILDLTQPVNSMSDVINVGDGNFYVRGDGYLEATNVFIRGNIQATSVTANTITTDNIVSDSISIQRFASDNLTSAALGSYSGGYRGAAVALVTTPKHTKLDRSGLYDPNYTPDMLGQRSVVLLQVSFVGNANPLVIIRARGVLSKDDSIAVANLYRGGQQSNQNPVMGILYDRVFGSSFPSSDFGAYNQVDVFAPSSQDIAGTAAVTYIAVTASSTNMISITATELKR